MKVSQAIKLRADAAQLLEPELLKSDPVFFTVLEAWVAALDRQIERQEPKKKR